jgi:hypothetical protein
MKLELTDKHASVLIAALDCYSRLQMGQLWALADAIETAKDANGATLPDAWQIREQYTDELTRSLFGYPPNASHGICSQHVPESAKVAYDLQCVIRADIAKRENHLRSSVWHGPPLHTAKAVPLAGVLP